MVLGDNGLEWGEGLKANRDRWQKEVGAVAGGDRDGQWWWV